MPVNSKHSEYVKFSKKWVKYRTVVEGEDDIKSAGTEFLPMLEGQNAFVGVESGGSSYMAYKDRASFFAATARIVDGIEGAVFRKDPVINFPKAKEDFLDSIGKEGSSLPIEAKKIFNNVLKVGRHGVLLDMPEEPKPDQTPYFSGYNAESVLNWRTARINDKEELVLIVLQEMKTVLDPKDPFVSKQKEFIRVLLLGSIEGDDNKGVPFYIVDLWEKLDSGPNKNKFIKIKTSIPKIRGQKMAYIPFVIFGPKELTSNVQKSPIADIVSINISHYRTSADLEHGRHFTALPTAWVAGFPVNTQLRIGSTTAWVSENPEAHAGFLEFTGQGLGALENALTSKEAQMAVLGARLLEEPKKAVESAETHIIRKGGEESVTASLSRTVSEGLTKLLIWSAEWMGLNTNDISCELNRDYSSVEMTPQMLQVLMTALMSGSISKDTWIYNLQRGELLPEGRTLEQEMDLIDQNPPTPSKEELDLGEEEEEDGEKK